jgi:hypothetical protein
VTSARIKGAAVAAVSLLTLGASAPTQPTRRALSGDLTKPLAQYTGAQFAALVQPLRYGQGATRARRCRGPEECRAAGRRVQVRVEAVFDADSLGPGALGPFGVIAARLRNTGAEMEARYNMRGGAQYVYYLIVVPGQNNTVRWILEELDTQGSAATHRTVASGRFLGCNHPFVRGARADFRTCAESGAARASFLPVSFGAQGGLEDPPIWIGCISGCCIAEEPPPTG